MLIQAAGLKDADGSGNGNFKIFAVGSGSLVISGDNAFSVVSNGQTGRFSDIELT